MATLSPEERRKKIGAVFRVAGGNFLEQYDFFIYGYYATYIARAFFPVGSHFASLMLSLATFGVGFLMRPLGGIVLGSYIDRKGRRAGLILTLGLMAVGTLTIALTPGYDSIGLAAPLVIVLGRLLQGFSAGAELGGVSVYLAEIATPGRRGFYTSWQSGSQQVAVIFASLLGVALTAALPPEDHRGLGLARAAADRVRDHPADPVDAPVARRDGGVPPDAARAPDRRRAAAPGRALAHGPGRRGHVGADDDDVLPHHRLHADVRARGAAPERERRARGHAVRGRVEPDLAAHRGRHLGPLRTLPAADADPRAHPGDVVSGHALARGRAPASASCW